MRAGPPQRPRGCGGDAGESTAGTNCTKPPSNAPHRDRTTAPHRDQITAAAAASAPAKVGADPPIKPPIASKLSSSAPDVRTSSNSGVVPVAESELPPLLDRRGRSQETSASAPDALFRDPKDPMTPSHQTTPPSRRIANTLAPSDRLRCPVTHEVSASVGAALSDGIALSWCYRSGQGKRERTSKNAPPALPQGLASAPSPAQTIQPDQPEHAPPVLVVTL
jgi:hypothetical protein